MNDGNIFEDLMNCLLIYEYPLAKSMNQGQLADVFSTSNRCFLISWIIKLINSKCGNRLQNIENSDECLAQLIYKMGLCLKTESLLFMKGDLPLEKQVCG